MAKVVEHILLAKEPIARQDLATAAGLTFGTITRAVNPLVGRLLSEVAEIAETGRPRKLLRLIPNAVTVAGISVKPSVDRSECFLTGVIVNLAGTVAARTDRKVLGGTQSKIVVDGIVTLLGELEANLGRQVDAIGIAIGGHVDGQRGVVHRSPNLHWDDEPVPLAELITDVVGRRVSVENDADAQAMYCHLFKGVPAGRWFAVVTIGLGIGCGIFVGTHVAHGATGRVGELGHIPVVTGPGATECRCGRRGCLETVATRESLLAAIKEAENRKFDSLTQAINHANTSSNSPASDVLAEAGAALGRAIATLVNIVDVQDVFVLHEGILDSKAFKAEMYRAWEGHLFPSPSPSEIRLVDDGLDVLSGAQGAAAGALFMLLRSGDVTKLGDAAPTAAFTREASAR